MLAPRRPAESTFTTPPTVEQSAVWPEFVISNVFRCRLREDQRGTPSFQHRQWWGQVHSDLNFSFQMFLDAGSEKTSGEHHHSNSDSGGAKCTPDRNLSFLEDDLLPAPPYLTSHNSLEDLLGNQMVGYLYSS